MRSPITEQEIEVLRALADAGYFPLAEYLRIFGSSRGVVDAPPTESLGGGSFSFSEADE